VTNRISQSNSDGVYLHCAVVPDLQDEMILAENEIARSFHILTVSRNDILIITT